jgi:2-keto-4-pentenoate hydratase/2-oxohepta-3-ene-1,7-dioic acid hydratase in catechol pathway
MQLRRVISGVGTPEVQAKGREGWHSLASLLAALPSSVATRDSERWSTDLVAFLGAPGEMRSEVARLAGATAAPVAPAARAVLPFEPRSFRDFMLYERHAIDAARGFARMFHPRLMAIVNAYEAVTRRPFPLLRPSRLWYREPIYYMGNHLAFVGDGAVISMPSYTQALDYELELGFVLARGLINASPAEAEAAIGGFVVLNDLSARDVQAGEMRSGFGPQKSKHFANVMSGAVITADEILPRWRSLRGFVRINGETVAEPGSQGARWSLGEVLAHASKSERLHAGELFGTGTLPGGSGIESGRLLNVSDTIEVGIAGIGSIANPIVATGGGET